MKTSAHTEIRRSDIRDMIMQGKSTKHISAYMLNAYSVGRRTVERDITAIYKSLREDFEQEKVEIINKHIMRYEYIYEKCVEIGDMKGARESLQAKEKLLQLYSPDNVINVQVNNNTLNLNTYTLEQLEAITKALSLNE